MRQGNEEGGLGGQAHALVPELQREADRDIINRKRLTEGCARLLKFSQPAKGRSALRLYLEHKRPEIRKAEGNLLGGAFGVGSRAISAKPVAQRSLAGTLAQAHMQTSSTAHPHKSPSASCMRRLLKIWKQGLRRKAEGDGGQ